MRRKYIILGLPQYFELWYFFNTDKNILKQLFIDKHNHLGQFQKKNEAKILPYCELRGREIQGGEIRSRALNFPFARVVTM